MLLSINRKVEVEFDRQVYFVSKYFCENVISEKLEEELNHEGFEIKDNAISNGTAKALFMSDYGYYSTNFIISEKFLANLRTAETGFTSEIVFLRMSSDTASEILRGYFKKLFNIIKPYINETE